MNSYWINLNSVQIFAENEEEAEKEAMETLNADPQTYLMDYEIVLDEENIEED